MDDVDTLIDLPADSIDTAFPTDDEDLFDSMNLSSKTTGLDGVIFISTRIPQHGPRIKWSPGPPGRGRPTCSFTLDDPPRLVANSLPRHIVRAATPDVARWIDQNRAALLSFWTEGAYWLEDERSAFAKSLAPLSR